MPPMERISVLDAYARSWRRRKSVIPIFIGVRLISLAIIAPVTGIAVSVAVAVSGQPALTDQDIVLFLFSPLGFCSALAAISVVLIGSVIGLATMTVDLRQPDVQGIGAIRSAVGRLAGRFPALLGYAVFLVLRVLAIVAPFAAASLLVAKLLIGSHDINYYLSGKPPEFLAAIALIALLLAAMTALLVSRLLSWALSLHHVLFGGIGAWRSFSVSRQSMAGRRTGLLRDLLLWLAIRLLLAFAIGVGFSLLLQTLLGVFQQPLRLFLTLVVILAAALVLAETLLAAISLGALADILNTVFGHPASQAGKEIPEGQQLFSVPVILGGSAVLIVLGFVAGGLLLDRIKAMDKVEIIAHRGAAGLRPENTLASIRKAIEDGADWVEVDVQETADGEVVVMHDSDFMKRAGVDLKIWDATMEDLATIDVGSWFDPAYASERIPRLEEVLEITRGRAKLLIELKYYGHDFDLEARTVQIVERVGMGEQVATMSLKYPAVQRMLDLRPDWRAGVLAATAIGDVARLEGDFVAVSASYANPHLVASTEAAGKDLYVWTVNDPLRMSAMISMGVDGIITDEPALARHVLSVRARMSAPERMMLFLAERLGLSLPETFHRDASP